MDGKKPMSLRVFKKYKSSSDQAYLLICFVSRYKKSILSSSDLKSLPYNHRAHPTQPITFFWSQMNHMTKIRLFYSGTMALILPRLKDKTNFVLKLICSLFTFKCLRGDLYSSAIYHWNCQLKPYWFLLRKNRVN